MHSFLSSSSLLETTYDYSRKEKTTPSSLDSCSQKAPYSRADDMASSKYKYNIDSFCDEADKLRSIDYANC